MRLLLVEDTERLAQSLAQGLREEGIDVHSVATGAAALRELAPEQVPTGTGSRLLLLSDDGSRRVDGKKCKRLRDDGAKRFRGAWLEPG